MGNKRNRRPRRLRTLSPDGNLSETQLETSTQGNDTRTNIGSNTQGTSNNDEIRTQLIEPSKISNEIQAWTNNFEQKINDRIMKMREEMENKLEAILKEIKSNKSASLATNSRSETNDVQNMQLSGSRLGQSNGVHASFDENSEPDNEGYPPQTSKIRDLRHPAKPLFRSESDVDVTIHSDEESDLEEDYHQVQSIVLVWKCGNQKLTIIAMNWNKTLIQKCDKNKFNHFSLSFKNLLFECHYWLHTPDFLFTIRKCCCWTFSGVKICRISVGLLYL